jgi:phosphoribosylanthranilate isomerase
VHREAGAAPGRRHDALSGGRTLPGVTRIKVCGITRLQDAELALEVGAWAVGLIFWPGSSRRCPLDEAAVVGAALKRRAEVAGVFVNAPLEDVAGTVEAVGATLVQLHGDEGPAYCAEVARRTGARVIKAARVGSGADIRALRPFHTDFHLLDARQEGRWGGTGQTWDWSLVEAHRGPPVLLSGGLTPENVGDAVRATRPWGVDVASGVEARPGIKDAERVRAFASAVAEAEAEAGVGA